MLAFDSSVLVEEKENRGLNCIRLQPVGSKKEYWLRFEVCDSLHVNVHVHVCSMEGGSDTIYIL